MIVFAGIMVKQLEEIKVVTDENIETLNNYEFVDCSDEYSIVSVDPALEA